MNISFLKQYIGKTEIVPKVLLKNISAQPLQKYTKMGPNVIGTY